MDTHQGRLKRDPYLKPPNSEKLLKKRKHMYKRRDHTKTLKRKNTTKKKK